MLAKRVVSVRDGLGTYAYNEQDHKREHEDPIRAHFNEKLHFSLLRGKKIYRKDYDACPRVAKLAPIYTQLDVFIRASHSQDYWVKALRHELHEEYVSDHEVDDEADHADEPAFLAKVKANSLCVV